MPTTTSITTTYAGEAAKQYIDAALLSGVTLANEAIDVRPNVKYRQVIRRIDTTSLVQDATCDFTPTETVTIDERILEPKELQVNLQLCKQDFVSTWDALELGYSAHDQVPKTFSDFIIAHVAEKVAAATEVSIWRGVAGAGDFDGFATLLSLDADLPAAQEVAGVAVTAANVIDELGKIYAAIPARLYGAEGLTMYVSQNIFKAYIIALGGFAAAGVGANGVDNKGTLWYGNQALNFGGVPLFMTNGLADNTAICTVKDNLVFGTGLLSDHNMVKLIDMADIDGSQNFRYIMRYTAGVQYGFASDIVTYGIVNAVN